MVKDNSWLSYIPGVVWYSISGAIVVIAIGFTYKTISSQSWSMEIPNKFKVEMNQAVSSMVNATSTVIAVNEELYHGIERLYKNMDNSIYQQNSGKSEDESKNNKGELIPKINIDVSFNENLKMSKDKIQESIQQMKEVQRKLEELKL